MIIDLFSRKVVGWEVWDCEKDVHAATLFERTTYKEKIKPGKLVLHSDNGPTMKAYTFRAKLEALGITTSYSRPRVSNDNPYAEAAFRTLKYCPQYPVHGFESIEKARLWVSKFIQWYNFEHLHSGINFVTPNHAHTGEYKTILAHRKLVLEAAMATNPGRWSKKKIRNLEPHVQVALNPTREKAYEQIS